jgi:uncharacterized protein (TIGR03067 family)
MRQVSALVLGLVVLLAGPSLAEDSKKDGKKDAEKLVGTWKMVSMDAGKGAKETDGFKLVISEKTIEFRAPNGAMMKMGDISRIDGSARPAQIDLKNGTETGPGIYELKGDDLKLIIRDPGQERAREFKGTPQGVLFVLKRDKP